MRLTMTLAALFLLLGLVLLYFGAEGLVRGSSSLALRLGLSPLVVGLTVVAFGTSSPELVVSLKAALDGQGAISVGNVVGSNICNIGLILGLCAIITPIATNSQVVRVDIPIMLGITVVTLFVLADGHLGRPEGILLAALLVAYVVFSIGLARHKPADALGAEFGEEVKISKRGLAVDVLMVIGGLVLLVFGARFLVDGAVIIAGTLGWSEALIGLTIVAIGTSLPELATSLVAVRVVLAVVYSPNSSSVFTTLTTVPSDCAPVASSASSCVTFTDALASNLLTAASVPLATSLMAVRVVMLLSKRP